MTIPIRNIYYLFLYAWNRFPLSGSTDDVGLDDCPDLPSLFAKLLLERTRGLFKRGLDRGYLQFIEETPRPRGRIRHDLMIRRLSASRGLAISEFDELSYDVPQNQILKATLRSLSLCSELTTNMRDELRSLATKFLQVSDIELRIETFKQAVVHRNNREYGFLMLLCELIFSSLMPDKQGHQTRFKNLIEDDVRMSVIWEEFLRNFCRINFSNYQVRSEAASWDVSDASVEDLSLLPRMVMDITLRSPSHTIIIDAKYYRSSLAIGPYGARLHSGHLYQIATYLQHERIRSPAMPLAGLLLYAKADRTIRASYKLLGTPLQVATIDLSRDWRDIEVSIRDVVASVGRNAEEAAGHSVLKVSAT